MKWRRKKPGYIGSIDEVQDRCEAEPSKELAGAYTRLFKENGNKVPSFRDLEMRDLKAAVPQIALCSVGVGEHCTIRFFGEELRARLGMNPVERDFFEFVHPDRADSIRRIMEMLVIYPCAYLANVRQEFTNGRTAVVETIAFPLASSRPGDDGQVILSDTPISDEGVTLDREKVLLSADAVWRDLIDLGYGVDRDFEDIVSG